MKNQRNLIFKQKMKMMQLFVLIAIKKGIFSLIVHNYLGTLMSMAFYKCDLKIIVNLII